MFNIPNGRTIIQPTFAYTATICCASLALFLIAATVVLALIPVFIPTKTITPNPDVLRSKEVVMSMEVQQNDAVMTKRRRRMVGDLYEYVNGTFDDTGKEMIREKLLATFPPKTVANLDIIEVSIAYKSPGRRKRFALRKRDAYPGQTIVMVIRFIIIYYPTCFYKCQLNKGPILQSKLQLIPISTWDFSGLQIYKYGLFFKIAPRIKGIRIIYVSLILPGLGSLTQTYPAITVTIASITITTTPMTTAVTTANLAG